jgi:hypothetical protein
MKFLEDKINSFEKSYAKMLVVWYVCYPILNDIPKTPERDTYTSYRGNKWDFGFLGTSGQTNDLVMPLTNLIMI